MKKVIALFMALLMITATAVSASACLLPKKTDQIPGTKADMSGYRGFDDADHVFVDTTIQDVRKAMDEGKTFTVYFGFSHCPWCIEAVPVLNEEAKKYDQKVYYICSRPKGTETSNTQMPDYDLVVDTFGPYLSTDKDTGVGPRLYVPNVFFIKDGKVVAHHEDTVDGHDARFAKMTDSQKKELAGIYDDGFRKELGLTR